VYLQYHTLFGGKAEKKKNMKENEKKTFHILPLNYKRVTAQHTLKAQDTQ